MNDQKERYTRVSPEQLMRMYERGELKATPDDAPTFDLPDEFFEKAVRVESPLAKRSVHLRLDSDVFDWFKAQGPGHLTRMNAVLKAYAETQRER